MTRMLSTLVLAVRSLRAPVRRQERDAIAAYARKRAGTCPSCPTCRGDVHATGETTCDRIAMQVAFATAVAWEIMDGEHVRAPTPEEEAVAAAAQRQRERERRRDRGGCFC